jgi:peptidoglycan/xylan/chitin deacetylase (PgdA/CDA1 family)
MSIAMSLHGRGTAGTLARTATVFSRFGASSAAMTRRLDRYADITSRFGVKPTWPATACVLARHPGLLRRYAEQGIELAVHGLVHGDHAVVDERRQHDTIARAVEIFHRHGLDPSGFRGPYLRYNDATLAVVRELGLRYHSSQAVVFPLLAAARDATARTSYALALRLYSAVDATRVAVRPRLLDGLVDIPVAVPDDEILLDRLAVPEPARSAEWLNILALTHDRGELFTIQLHPERIYELGEALRMVLAEAHRRRPAVYVATLDEIARWWQRRAGSTLTVARREHGRIAVSLDGDEHATLLVRGLEVPRTPWYGRDERAASPRFETDAPRFPAVGVSRRSPAAVATFLADEGFAVEVSDDPGAYGAHVDVADEDWSEADVLATVERSQGPLVRLWRWPDGARSALAATGDIDALTLRDFVLRSWETREWVAPRDAGHE